MKLKFLAMAAIILFSTMAVNAQSKSDSAKKYQQIEELFKVIKLEELCQATAQQAANQLIAQNQLLENKRPEIESFYVKYLGYEYMKELMAKLYAQEYTTDELKELVRFHKTSAGKKFVNASAAITAEAYKQYSANLEANQKELQDLINQPNQ